MLLIKEDDFSSKYKGNSPRTYCEKRMGEATRGFVLLISWLLVSFDGVQKMFGVELHVFMRLQLQITVLESPEAEMIALV